MNERKKLILQAIVESYVHNAEPVGSRNLSRNYDLGISAATIRNEMADLEEQGFLLQPHTSSGRIPSQKGYRYYVDCLMPKAELTESETELINHKYEEKQRSDVLIQEATKLLSEITNYISVAQGPRWQESIFKQLKLLLLDEKTIMAVMITNTGLIRNKIIEIEKKIEQEQLETISWMLNKKFQGASLEKIETLGWKEIEKSIRLGSDILEQTMKLFHQALDYPEDKVYYEGTGKILDHPEFKDLDKFRSLLNVLEQNSPIAKILSESSKKGELSIIIGEENKYWEMNDCSIVTASYQVSGETFGTIGVVGPTRMEYSKVITAVEYVAKMLGEILSRMR